MHLPQRQTIYIQILYQRRKSNSFCSKEAYYFRDKRKEAETSRRAIFIFFLITPSYEFSCYSSLNGQVGIEQTPADTNDTFDPFTIIFHSSSLVGGGGRLSFFVLQFFFSFLIFLLFFFFVVVRNGRFVPHFVAWRHQRNR